MSPLLGARARASESARAELPLPIVDLLGSRFLRQPRQRRFELLMKRDVRFHAGHEVREDLRLGVGRLRLRRRLLNAAPLLRAAWRPDPSGHGATAMPAAIASAAPNSPNGRVRVPLATSSPLRSRFRVRLSRAQRACARRENSALTQVTRQGGSGTTQCVARRAHSAAMARDICNMSKGCTATGRLFQRPAGALVALVRRGDRPA